MKARPAIAFLASVGAVVASLAGSNPTRQASLAVSARLNRAPTAQVQVEEAFGRVPIHFEANLGQAHPTVRFVGRGNGYTLSLTGNEAIIALSGRASRRDRKAGEEASPPSVLRTRLVGASADPKVHGADALPGKANYFLGNDPRKWRRNVPLYARVACEAVYPGIDLVYYGNRRQIEYDFVVAPHADPESIRIRFEGARSLRVDGAGDLRIALAEGEVVHRAPKVRQRDTQGREEPVAGRWSVSGFDASFELGPHDSSLSLLIDPVLEYSTYLGSTTGDYAMAIAVDQSGAVFIAGVETTASPTDDNTFVAKLSPEGNALVYFTRVGGSLLDEASAIAVDSGGNAYVAGATLSENFPVRDAFQPALAGAFDGFVLKLSPTGDSLTYSTYLGGHEPDFPTSMAVDRRGSAYVTGYTLSTDFPTRAPFLIDQPDDDAFVTKLSPTGSELVYSTYLGGDSLDRAAAIALDDAASVYVTGYTYSYDFPTQNAFQPTYRGTNGPDAFVTKFAPTGAGLLYSSYLGGDGGDWGAGIAVDGLGAAYVVGSTNAADFPVLNPFQTFGGWQDGFVSKVAPSGAGLSYSTYLGGADVDEAISVAVEARGSAYVTGRTQSVDFPRLDSHQDFAGGVDVFVSRLTPMGDSLAYSTFLGGSSSDYSADIVLDGAGAVYVTGHTYSADFTTRNPLFTYQGGADAFVSKIGFSLPTGFWTIPPCRVVDTRNAPGPFGAPALVAGADRVFPIAGQCNVPMTADSVAVNVTVTEPTAAGHLRVFPAGGRLPSTSTLNYSAGQTRAGNGVFMLGSGGTIAVRCHQASGTAHLVVDVTGYFE